MPLASQLAEEEARAEMVRAEAAAARRELAAREDALSAMERDLLATARRRKEQDLDRFVADVQADLRARIYEVCCDVLESIRRRGGALPGNSVKQLRNLVEAVGRLKFWDDADLDREMAAIRSLLAVEPRQRSPAAITNLVERLGAESRIALLELDRAPGRSGRDAGLPDDATALQTLVRRARSTPTDLFDAFRVPEGEIARPGRGARAGAAGGPRRAPSVRPPSNRSGRTGRGRAGLRPEAPRRRRACGPGVRAVARKRAAASPGADRAACGFRRRPRRRSAPTAGRRRSAGRTVRAVLVPPRPGRVPVPRPMRIPAVRRPPANRLPAAASGGGISLQKCCDVL